MHLTSQNQVLLKILQRCKQSPSFFLSSFARIEHPSLGVIPFNLYDYQRKCLADFMKHRFNIFRKTRQAGISTLCGGFVLWYSMFYANKTILIVSKGDRDAIGFLRRNIKFLYDHLPEWMREMWPKRVDNEHQVGFPNGSLIMSLPSGKDVLRSHASSLNIIDEAAFIPYMDELWTAGWSTLVHGGSVIIVSTPKGVGDWYWKTWTDSEQGANDFHPITVNWWDMRWELEYADKSGNRIKIAPTKDIRDCTPEEKPKYGQFWSPWLEEQYRQLTQKDDPRKFRQEVLAAFLGSGDTVLSPEVLNLLSTHTSNDYKVVETVNYVNPYTDERQILDFEKKLWIWKEPVRDKFDQSGKVISDAHIYILGADSATGDGEDFSTIIVFDITMQEQVAELQIQCPPKILAYMIDYLGRYYNNAMAVVERTGIGVGVCQDLYEFLMYPNLYRSKRQATVPGKKKKGMVGFATTRPTKPFLNKALIDHLGEDGYRISSFRLYKELCIYVHLKGGKTGAEPGRGNYDDLTIGAALALMATNLAITSDSLGLVPIRHADPAPRLISPQRQQEMQQANTEAMRDGGPGLLPPIIMNPNEEITKSGLNVELAKFTRQLSTPSTRPIPAVTKPKHQIELKRKRK